MRPAADPHSFPLVARRQGDQVGDGCVVASLPRFISQAGERTAFHSIEFLSARIANPHTRAAYGRAILEFCAWCEDRELSLPTLSSPIVAAYIHELGTRLSAASTNQHLSAIRNIAAWEADHRGARRNALVAISSSARRRPPAAHRITAPPTATSTNPDLDGVVTSWSAISSAAGIDDPCSARVPRLSWLDHQATFQNVVSELLERASNPDEAARLAESIRQRSSVALAGPMTTGQRGSRGH